MEINYHNDIDVLEAYRSDAKVESSIRENDFIFHISQDEEIVAFEILNASRYMVSENNMASENFEKFLKLDKEKYADQWVVISEGEVVKSSDDRSEARDFIQNNFQDDLPLLTHVLDPNKIYIL